MSSGFVSGGVADFSEKNPSNSTSTSQDQDAWAKAEEAVKLARWQQEEKGSLGKNPEEKSLYEILQANKARKQEEFEEKLKFKNQFKPLDEDDVEFLDSIMSEQARMEHLRKQELASQLNEFRKAQEEAENAGHSEALENIPKVEDVVIGGWSASGRKRKKSSAVTNTGTGPKIRKMSDPSGKAEKVEPNKLASPPQPASLDQPTNKTENVEKVSKLVLETADNKRKTPVAQKPSMAKGTLVGLVNYSSDDDDDD